jgi:hypothetical protein
MRPTEYSTSRLPDQIDGTGRERSFHRRGATCCTRGSWPCDGPPGILSDATHHEGLTLSTHSVLRNQVLRQGRGYGVSGSSVTEAGCVMARAEEASVCPEHLPEA